MRERNWPWTAFFDSEPPFWGISIGASNALGFEREREIGPGQPFLTQNLLFREYRLAHGMPFVLREIGPRQPFFDSEPPFWRISIGAWNALGFERERNLEF